MTPESGSVFRDRLLAVAFLAILTAGCGGGDATQRDIGADNTGDTVTKADGVLPDGQPLDGTTELPDLDQISDDWNPYAELKSDAEIDLGGPKPGEFGWPCHTNEDCLSGYCMPFGDGSVCTQFCVEECPEGWQCKAATNTWPDVLYICVPFVDRLCKPCATSFDCAAQGDLCMEVGQADGKGLYCLRDCSASSCPDGYSCVEILDEDDGTILAKQCAPDTESCVCTAALNGTTRPCSVTNQHGTCAGEETCQGPLGWTGCTAPEAAPERCDDVDNNCNGVTDEGCDDDTDQYCDASMELAGTPAICPLGGGDCNDNDKTVYPGAPEFCNGKDNDCNGTPDNDVVDCQPYTCTGSADNYFQADAAECVGGKCVAPDAVGCGLYTCEGGGTVGEFCGSSCQSDVHCIPSAHCDEVGSVCVLDFPNGQGCVEESDCISGHCQNGFCCLSGDCCAQPANCPHSYWLDPVCNDTATCQGTRNDAQCVSSRCKTSDDIPDDSACGTALQAVDCSPYLPRYCTGQVNQSPPQCPTACGSDADCQPTHYCDQVCVPKRENGESCTQARVCASGHCQNGFCCQTGDCCSQPSNCSTVLYARPAVCNDSTTCQGTRNDRACVDYRCATGPDAEDDSACGTGLLSLDCTPNAPVFCKGTAEQTPPICPTECAAHSDCAPGYHCEGTCVPDLTGGTPCTFPEQCQSAHCRNGFCCTSGDCCSVADDCPASYAEAPKCTNAATCQGTRLDATCQGFICKVSAPVADDSACATDLLSRECTPYLPVYCNGSADQTTPPCPTACILDDECLAGYHCDGTCKPDLPHGQPCDEASDCISKHCQNGFCCPGGDCCGQPLDCPANYSTAPVCESSTTCQGTRRDAVCSATKVCSISGPLDDDSACGAGLMALECTPYLPRHCTGQVVQAVPSCPTSCTQDVQCLSGFHCEGTCVADYPNGSACLTNSQCGSKHCQNGFCCGSGDCCAQASDCDGGLYGETPKCTSPSSCQGHRKDPMCHQFRCAKSTALEDDSGCNTTVLANECGTYKPIFCNGLVEQTPPQCPTSCTSHTECDTGSHCNGVCTPNLPLGSGCTQTAQCQSGYCVDGVCCSSSCTGLCRRCDLPGSLGTCANVGNSVDPDGECAGFSCSGYFWGWSGSSCYRRSDVSDAAAACNGAGACHSAATLCPSQGQGGVANSCHATCQSPTAGTCTGTAAGTCTNVNPGNQTCGVGACVNTVPVCLNGAPNSCSPLPVGTETCNNIDDDCDGTVDNNMNSTYNTYEPNNSCAAPADLGQVIEGGTQTWTAEIYPTGDQDYYRVLGVEQSNVCFPFATETFKITVTMTPPQGADCRNYNLQLYSDGCGLLATSSNSSCSTETVSSQYDGMCAFNDDRYFRIRVWGVETSDWECKTYSLTVKFEQL